MTETKIFNNKNEGVLVANSRLYQQPTKITGILTSQIRSKPSSDTPFMAFSRSDSSNKHSLAECERTKCKDCEIPVIFRIKKVTERTFKKYFRQGLNAILEEELIKLNF